MRLARGKAKAGVEREGKLSRAFDGLAECIASRDVVILWLVGWSTGEGRGAFVLAQLCLLLHLELRSALLLGIRVQGCQTHSRFSGTGSLSAAGIGMYIRLPFWM